MYFVREKTDPAKIAAAGAIGALVGIVAGLLFAPKSGKEHRQIIKDWSTDMTDKVKDSFQKTKDAAQDKINQVAGTVAEKKDKADTIQKNEVNDLGKDLKGRWQNVKDEWSK